MKTKNIILILLALFLICPVMHSQKSVDQLFKNFSKEKGVTMIDADMFSVTFRDFFKITGVKGVEIFSFDECEQSVRDKLNSEIASLKDDDFETIASINKEGSRLKFLVRLQGETIKEFVMLKIGEDPSILRIKGKIKLSDVEKVIKSDK